MEKPPAQHNPVGAGQHHMERGCCEGACGVLGGKGRDDPPVIIKSIQKYREVAAGGER